MGMRLATAVRMKKNALTKKITATKPTIPEGVKNRNPVGRRRNRNK
jgi:hypothetical protein